MDILKMQALMERVKSGEITTDEAVLALRRAPFEDLGFAKLDLHRGLRQGVAEVIYGAGKTPEQIETIAQTLYAANKNTVLITRMSESAAQNLLNNEMFQYFPVAKLGILGKIPEANGKGKIVVVTGGTSDMPVAEEAALCAMALGNEVVRLYDVGVAGLHRLLSNLEALQSARVIIAIAGMEGALASVVGGLVACPVIAVPTSVGYGAAFEGLAALLSMLNSCSSGVSVVNIDNGFGAAFQASLINHI